MGIYGVRGFPSVSNFPTFALLLSSRRLLFESSILTERRHAKVIDP